MHVYYTKDFEKQFGRIGITIQRKFKARLDLFLLDQIHPSLRVHSLKGKYAGYMSMNITGDVRALYKVEGGKIVIFAFIGTTANSMENRKISDIGSSYRTEDDPTKGCH